MNKFSDKKRKHVLHCEAFSAEAIQKKYRWIASFLPMTSRISVIASLRSNPVINNAL